MKHVHWIAGAVIAGLLGCDGHDVEAGESGPGPLESRMLELSREIGELETDAKELRGEARAEIDRVVGELRAREGELRTKLAEWKTAGKEEWSTLRADLEARMKALESDARQAIEKAE